MRAEILTETIRCTICSALRFSSDVTSSKGLCLTTCPILSCHPVTTLLSPTGLFLPHLAHHCLKCLHLCYEDSVVIIPTRL